MDQNAQAAAKRQADEARVLAVLSQHPDAAWRFKAVLAQLQELGGERVRAALTRLTVRSELEQAVDGQLNHYTWRVCARED